MQKIVPHLWFDSEAKEAAEFYVSVLGGEVKSVTLYPNAGQEIHGRQAGSVMTVDFTVRGFEMLALNGGPVFNFTPAISITVECESAEEVDRLWGSLIDGGTALMDLDTYPFSPRYGWLRDRYGLTWQLIYHANAESHRMFPSLMFTGDVAGRAEEAMGFYTKTFPRSEIGMIARYGAGAEPDVEGSVTHGIFVLEDQTFSAMDSAHPHQFNFNEALSFLVRCEDQAEIDRLWSALSAHPEAEQCGWLKDRYGVSWQIVPANLGEILGDDDTAVVDRRMAMLLSMKKIDIETLRAA
ncbi:MAG TPA: VOC family protein [Candidatus Paceibacterota bacterium]|nr:VOC family protein [Candidatus Paceibacterota bacterium]